jgi:hypothetical protein
LPKAQSLATFKIAKDLKLHYCTLSPERKIVKMAANVENWNCKLKQTP